LTPEWGRWQLVRLDNPLKQGLKQAPIRLNALFGLVRLDNPLKQGLKQHQISGPATSHASAWTIH